MMSDNKQCTGEDTCQKMKYALAAATEKNPTVDSAYKDIVAGLMTSVTMGFCYWCKKPIR